VNVRSNESSAYDDVYELNSNIFNIKNIDEFNSLGQKYTNAFGVVGFIMGLLS